MNLLYQNPQQMIQPRLTSFSEDLLARLLMRKLGCFDCCSRCFAIQPGGLLRKQYKSNFLLSTFDFPQMSFNASALCKTIKAAFVFIQT